MYTYNTCQVSMHLHHAKRRMRYDLEKVSFMVVYYTWKSDHFSCMIIYFVVRMHFKMERFLNCNKVYVAFILVNAGIEEYCSSVLIDVDQLTSAHNMSNKFKFKSKKTKQNHLHNNRPKWLLLIKASSYLSIRHSNVTSCRLQR